FKAKTPRTATRQQASFLFMIQFSFVKLAPNFPSAEETGANLGKYSESPKNCNQIMAIQQTCSRAGGPILKERVSSRSKRTPTNNLGFWRGQATSRARRADRNCARFVE